MKRYFGLAFTIGVLACGLHAQTVNTTVCAVLNNPKAFNGKMVQIKGTVVVNFDQFMLTDGNCGQQVNGIWLDYPAGSKAKAGALVKVTIQPAKSFKGTVEPANETAVTLQKDKEFKQFDSVLSQWHDSDSGICLGCAKYTVTATVVGRLDGINDPLMGRDDKGAITSLGGFGNANAYPARLVIQSVSGVAKNAVDYTKAEAEVKPKDSGPATPAQPSYGDALEKLQSLAASMAPSDSTTQVQNDVKVLPQGKAQNPNDAMITYGVTNEPAARAASSLDSPSGVIVNCAINRSKLDTLGQEMALIYAAQAFQDAVNPPPSNYTAPLYIRTNNAWAMAATVGVSAGIHGLILPGGYVMWSGKWPASDQVNNMMAGLADFLDKEELLTR